MTAGRKVITGSVHWNTPLKYVEAITRVLGVIELDPCSNNMSIVGAITAFEHSGLDLPWDNYKTIFVNPPYGRGIYDWLAKCNQHTNGEVIALIPVATNTKHWKDHVFKSDCICLLSDTRLKFMIDGTTNNKGASMACCVVYWGGDVQKFIQVFREYGQCVITVG